MKAVKSFQDFGVVLSFFFQKTKKLIENEVERNRGKKLACRRERLK
jgi:hypothetical protein